MDDEAAFERAMLASPLDDSARLQFADWLEGRGDRRGNFLRTWFALRDASNSFETALSHWATIDHHVIDGFFDDALAFWDEAGRYQRCALAVDRHWLWRLGASRPWIDQGLALLVAKCILWEGGLDPQILMEEQSIELERAWVFCYDGPDAPSRRGSQECPPKDGLSWYLLHKYLGRFIEVDSRDTTAAMQDLERRP